MNHLASKMVPSVIGIMLFTTHAWAAPVLPRLNQSDLVYKGAFRVPQGSTFSYGGGPIAYNPDHDSLVVGTYKKSFVEISIPQPVNSSSLAALPKATILQAALDPTSGNWNNIAGGGAAVGNGGSPGGVLYFNGKLIGTSYGYYDANNESVVSHFTASPNWATTGNQFSGFYQVGEATKTGVVAGYMASIPASWQADFGGSALTGLGAIAIFSRTSAGPAASVFDPAKLGVTIPLPATPVVGYSNGHSTLGPYSGTSLYYNRGTQLKGLVFPEGTSSVLFFGRQGLGSTGLGNSCYGSGTATLSQAKDSTELCAWFAANPTETVYSCGGAYIQKASCAADPCCYDPTDGSKGVHAFPYVYYVWAYDANDLLAAKTGHTVTVADYVAGRFVTDMTTTPHTLLAVGQTVNPWNVKPYDLWTLTLPISPNTAGAAIILGAAYDPATQRIFISQDRADKYGLEPLPVIHVFQVNLSSSATPKTPLNLKGTVVK